MNKTLKTIICIVLALCAIFLVYKIYDGIMEPVRFNKEVEARQKVAVQRLKDIRDLQVAFKSVNERSAMQMTAVYVCVRILSEATAGLPLHLC